MPHFSFTSLSVFRGTTINERFYKSAMPICGLSTSRHFRRFIVYDMEWIPGSLDIRIVGVYDGNRYRRYFSVEQFLNGELTSENRGRWFYAHAGGLADVQFVFEALNAHPEYQVKAMFSGSSAIIVQVKRGKNTWTFLDSYWLLKDKLANIAKSLGMQKTGPQEDDTDEIEKWYATVSMDELETYNQNDCVILWKAIAEFELSLLSLGGELKKTLASCAMALFRRKYLTNEIETHDSVNEKAMLTYVSSRVEVFRREIPVPSNHYDVNSLFPYAMTHPLPGELIGASRDLPLPGNLYMADVEIEVPDLYLTPIPVRMSGRVFFPSGRWRAWVTSIDLELLLKECGKLHKVYQVLIFEPFHDLGQYARDLYTRRKNTTDAWEKMVLKYLLNTLYGKFAEGETKSIVHLHPSETLLQKRLSHDFMLFPGCYEEELIVPVPHRWVPISSFITAIGRKTLYEFLSMTRHFYYCDTDSIVTKDEFSTSKELGALKLEKVISKQGLFIAPKLYREDDLVKAKGFSLGWDENRQHKKKRAIELFETLVSGGEITVKRMRRIKENLKAGSVKPKEEPIKKRLSKNPISKRCHNSKTGVSRPWTIEELRKKGLK